MSSVDRVYHDLREAIVQGWFAPGSPLRLNELTRQYGVSLIPIREALRRLEVERLVESTQNRGARVASISNSDVSDGYAMRRLLECQALRMAWPRLDAEFVAWAEQLLRDMFGAFERGELAEGAVMHRQYHFAIFERAESPWLDHLIRILWRHTERYRNLALLLQTPQRKDNEYHLELIEAIKARDLDRAVESTENELIRASDLVLASFRQRYGDQSA